MSLKWKRSHKIPYPSVWHRFSAVDLDGPALVEYEIRDLTENDFTEAVEFAKEFFLVDEALAKVQNLVSEPDSVEAFVKLWRSSMDQKMPIGCFKGDELVGVNFLSVISMDDPKIEETFGGPVYQVNLRLYNWIRELFNPFVKFGIEFYLAGDGMGVAREYRRRGIATAFLKARISMMKELGIRYTSTLFSGLGSQKAATKAGYKVYYELQ